MEIQYISSDRKEIPGSGLELVPEVLEFLVPHVMVGKDIDGGVVVDGMSDFSDYFALAL
jgi:hypothetical protein